MKFLLLSFIVLGACSFKKTGLENQTLKGHDELYSKPHAPKLPELEKTEKRIIIAATNDVQGNYQATALPVKDSKDKNQGLIRVGGIDVMANYFKILRDTYKNVVLIDSGNVLKDSQNLQYVSLFYETLGYDAFTVGLRDFNLQVPENLGNSTGLIKRLAETTKTPLVLSNLYDLKTSRLVEWKGTKPYIIKDVNGVKVGILGLIPDDIAGKTPITNRVGFYVENMLQSTLKHARLVRSLGAEVIVVMTNDNLDCVSDLAAKMKLPLTKVNFEPSQSNICDLKSPMGQFLERLPPGLVDVVIGGRNDRKTANFINGTLLLAGFGEGKSFSFAEFIVDSKTKKVIPSRTVAHQPVMFCHEFFNATKDCYPYDSSIDHQKRIPATFLGQHIERNLELEKKFPNLSSDKNVSVLKNADLEKALSNFQVDLTYSRDTSGDTQLFVIKLKGKELAQILDEDFNRKQGQNWFPSPYKVINEKIELHVGDTSFDLEKEYKVLTDLESIQKDHRLVQEILSQNSMALQNHSWISFEEDSVSSSFAAQSR